VSVRGYLQHGPQLARRIAGHRLLEPFVALVLRARAVRGSVAFVARELTGRKGLFSYRLREFPAVRVGVRHSSGDPVTLGEVFHERDYRPPPEMDGFAPTRIVDLGANVGYFGAYALARWPGCSVRAYEPDPENAAVHCHTMALNLFGSRWQLERTAATTTDGEIGFAASGDALSRKADDGALKVRSADVLPIVASADLLKMDIEGGEWEILTDPRFAADPPARVVLEFHPEGAPGDDDPEAEVLELLAAAGLTCTFTSSFRLHGYGLVWAWRP